MNRNLQSTIVNKLASASTRQSKAVEAPPRIVVAEEVIDFTGGLGDDDVDAEDLLSDVELDLVEYQLGSRTLAVSARVGGLDDIERVVPRIENLSQSDRAGQFSILKGRPVATIPVVNRDGEDLDPEAMPSLGHRAAISPQMIARNKTADADSNYGPRMTRRS